MVAVRRTLLVVALLAGLSAVRASADESDDRMASARADGVRRLEALASWCQEVKIEGARHRTLRAILSIDPDHRDARSVLRYYRAKKDGPWIQLEGYREPLDWDKNALAEHGGRYEAAVKAYRDDVLAVLNRMDAAAAARFTSVLEGLVRLLPGDELVRGARGDVRLGGAWVMAETGRAVTRRKELRRLVEKALRDLPPPVHAAAGTREWSVSLQTAHTRVEGTVEVAEADQIARLVEAAKSLVEAVFPGVKPILPPPRIVLLQSAGEGEAFVRTYPGLGETAWREVQPAGLSARWLPEGGGYVTWYPGPKGRKRLAVHAVLRALVETRFGDARRGWLPEGVARLLCWHLAGSHGSAGVVALSETDLGEGKGTLQLDDAKDWLPPARRTLLRSEPHRFPALLTTVLNAMDDSDILIAYALAGYVIEGIPEKATTFISATIANDDASVAVQTGLGMSIDALRSRLTRWLGEMEAR